MHIGTIRRRQLLIAGAAAAFCTSFSAAQATTITNGVYLGAPGANASGSDTNLGGAGGIAYTFTGGSNLISGGQFLGGTGGNATGGNAAAGGDGGNAVELQSSGSLTITAGSFQGGAGGTGSGAMSVNANGSAGSAIEVFSASSMPTPVQVFGGTFQGAFDFVAEGGGKVELYGTFDGGPRTITSESAISGTFSGLLNDNTTPATYSYVVEGDGELILEPEPTTCAALVIPALMLMRRRRVLCSRG